MTEKEDSEIALKFFDLEIASKKMSESFRDLARIFLRRAQAEKEIEK